METPALDHIDRRMLTLLQRNNRRTLRALADELSISAPTCLRRMRRLEKLGVIRAHAALVDPISVGLGVLAYVEVSLVNASGAGDDGVRAADAAVPRGYPVRELSGDVDYLLTVGAARTCPPSATSRAGTSPTIGESAPTGHCWCCDCRRTGINCRLTRR